MSNLKSPVYSDGPFETSERVYKGYLKCVKDYSDRGLGLYDLWLNEGLPNTVRSLALRTLLRNSADSPSDNRKTRDADSENDEKKTRGPERLKITDELYRNLKNRPKLRTEIIGEFLYNLENGYTSRTTESDIEILELLLSVAKETDLETLWNFHPLTTGKFPSPRGLRELDDETRLSLLLRLTNRRAKLPRSLREKIWTILSELIISVIEKWRSELEGNGNLWDNASSWELEPSRILLKNFRDYVLAENAMPENRDERLIVECLELLEKHLPKNVFYLSQIQLAEILERLDLYWCPYLVNDLTHRFFMKSRLDVETDFPSAKYYYFVRGIMSRTSRWQHACFNVIDNYIYYASINAPRD